jgi:predicted mannosyl-3-phosphoglycerate phosphatase (HAD superfamily)
MPGGIRDGMQFLIRLIAVWEKGLRETPCVLYMGVDALIPARGRSSPGLDEFTAALEHAGTPAVWLTNRTRLEFDAPRRKLGHNQPFIAEGGSGVFLPAGYFHLKLEETLRLGRYICIPIAEVQPAAAEALEDLSEETGVPVVTMASLSPRELVQNTGLPQREAELVRQRDFDEVFFFAGASERDIQRFVTAAREKKYALRQNGVMWSLALGASVKRCVQSLSKMYDRVLRYHPTILGLATEEEGAELFAACDRRIVLDERSLRDGETEEPSEPMGRGTRPKHFGLRDPELWPRLLEELAPADRSQ